MRRRATFDLVVENRRVERGVVGAKRQSIVCSSAAIDTFESQATLVASGASFADVVMINTFHVWQGPNFAGTRDEQFAAFERVAGEFFKPPYAAWTAVGTTGLLSDGGIVEVQLIARIP